MKNFKNGDKVVVMSKGKELHRGVIVGHCPNPNVLLVGIISTSLKLDESARKPSGYFGIFHADSKQLRMQA